SLHRSHPDPGTFAIVRRVGNRVKEKSNEAGARSSCSGNLLAISLTRNHDGRIRSSNSGSGDDSIMEGGSYTTSSLAPIETSRPLTLAALVRQSKFQQSPGF